MSSGFLSCYGKLISVTILRDMKVSEVQIRPVKPKDGLVAFASLVVNDEVFLGSIAIYKRLGARGYRLTYPTKAVGEKDFEIYHPISRDAGSAISEAILKKAEQILG